MQPKKPTKSQSTKQLSIAPESLTEDENVPVVAVGASAGGLEAFTDLLSHLPTDTGMAFVLVQHLDPKHESILTELISRAIKMPVREVKDGIRIEANHVYVIPPNTTMTIQDDTLCLSAREEFHGSIWR